MTTARPIVTITLNPAIDQTLSVPNFAAGKVNRVAEEQIHAGGKGVNVATVLADLRVPVIVSGLLGDANAHVFEQLFHRKKIDDRFVRVPGQTRVGIKIVDDQNGETTDINFNGLSPSESAVKELLARVEALAEPGRWFVLSGSVPAGVPSDIYAQFIDRITARRGKVVLDTSGQPLRDALAAGPNVVKPNIAELSELVGRPLETEQAVVNAAHSLLQECRGELVVVSMGGDGAIFLDPHRTVIARPPKVNVLSTVGAGDAMVAGIVFGRHHELPLHEIARLATALGAHAVTRIGAGLETPSVHESYFDQIKVVELTGQPS